MITLFATGITCQSRVGRCFLQELSKQKNYEVICLVRDTSAVGWFQKFDVQLRIGNLDEIDSFAKYMEEVDIVVNIAGTRKALNVIKAMERAGVKRGIFVNTTGVFSKFKAASSSYKLIESEMLNIFKNKKIEYVIVRPTMIYGNVGDRNIIKYIKYLNKYSFFPIFGGGSALIQPVYYKDVAKALVALVENEQCWGKAYNISGGTPITYKRFIETIAEALGKKVKFIYLPLQPIVYVVSILNKVFRSFPLKVEQILRTTEDRAFDYTDAKNCFGYNPISFEEGIRLEIEELKREGYLI